MFKNIIRDTVKWTIATISFFFMFIPESFFEKEILNLFFLERMAEKNIIINRIIFSFTAFLMILFIVFIYKYFIKKRIIIKDKDYIIEIKYGDIYKEKECKKVINFDECFTNDVGSKPYQIKENSICGQYLLTHKELNIKKLIKDNKIKNAETNSLYKNKKRYCPGTILPNGDDLLMAFAKLDEDGIAKFCSVDEYLNSLENLWKELNKFYDQKDVSIPILGAGITRINDSILSQQELLEKIIFSYLISPYKLKKPYKLRIICRKNDDFSLERIKYFNN